MAYDTITYTVEDGVALITPEPTRRPQCGEFSDELRVTRALEAVRG